MCLEVTDYDWSFYIFALFLQMILKYNFEVHANNKSVGLWSWKGFLVTEKAWDRDVKELMWLYVSRRLVLLVPFEGNVKLVYTQTDKEVIRQM